MDKAAKPSGVFVCSVTHGYDRLSALLLTDFRQAVQGPGQRGYASLAVRDSASEGGSVTDVAYLHGGFDGLQVRVVLAVVKGFC